MHTEISVGRVHQALQVTESQRLVCGQSADDPQTQSFMNQPIQLRRKTAGGSAFEFTEPLAAWFCFFCVACFSADCLATVPPCDDDTKNYVKPAKAGRHKPIGQSWRRKKCDRAQRHEAKTHDGHDRTENIPPVTTPVP